MLHRYIREKIENKKDKQRERSKLNVILRHHIIKHNLSELKTSDFAKYRDDRVAAGITNSTINRELSAGFESHSLHHCKLKLILIKAL